MLATSHAIVGAAIANRFDAPIVSFPLILISHFILDAIPHWDIGTNWKNRSKTLTGILAIAETILGITVAYFLYSGKVEPLYLLTAIGISELPDWLEAPWYIFFAKAHEQKTGSNNSIWKKILYVISEAEAKFHTRAQLPWGFITQVVVVLLVLLIFNR